MILGLLVGLAAGGLATWAFLQHHGQEEKKEEHKQQSRLEHGTNGETYLKLDHETQARVGLKVLTLEAAEMKPEVKGYGRVLDPAPLAALSVEGATAQASLTASTKEFERLKNLYAQDQNVSARSFETAEAAMKRDQIQVGSCKARLALAFGTAVATQVDLRGFVDSLTSLKTALARVDLPLGTSLKSVPSGGRLAAITAEDSPVGAQFLGRVTSTDPQTQGEGFLFLLKTNPLPPGAALIGWLNTPGDVQMGVVVPRPALVRHEGDVFVYVQTGDENFQRRKIELDRPAESGWFVTNGVAAREKIVIVGAQQLLSEELKSQGGEE